MKIYHVAIKRKLKTSQNSEHFNLCRFSCRLNLQCFDKKFSQSIAHIALSIIATIVILRHWTFPYGVLWCSLILIVKWSGDLYVHPLLWCIQWWKKKLLHSFNSIHMKIHYFLNAFIPKEYMRLRRCWKFLWSWAKQVTKYQHIGWWFLILFYW